MNDKHMVIEFRKKEVLKRNKKIDARVVRVQVKLERELRGLGVEV